MLHKFILLIAFEILKNQNLSNNNVIVEFIGEIETYINYTMYFLKYMIYVLDFGLICESFKFIILNSKYNIINLR